MHRVLLFPIGEIASPSTMEESGGGTEFVLFSLDRGVLSRHSTAHEAETARWLAAAEMSEGERLPTVIERPDPDWNDAA